MYHVTIGDPPDTIGSGSVTSAVCMCACPTCMSGSCCRTTTAGVPSWRDTVTWPTTMPALTTPLADADGRPLPGYWRCVCQTIVPPGVEHRCPKEWP